jgi:hypothetical protein
MKLTGNKGEWSETYALLSLVSAGVIQIVDEEFRPTGSTVGVVAVERGSLVDKTTYRIDHKKKYIRVEGGGEFTIVEISEIEAGAKRILEVLQGENPKSGIPEVEVLLARLRVTKLAASSINKSDVRIIVQDSKTTSRLDMPMSVKSMIGSPPSLLNASGATNFEYTFNCNEALKDELIALGRKPKAIVQRLIEERIPLSSLGPTNSTFNSNLMLSDSVMPRLLSELIVQYYSGSYGDLFELINDVSAADPLGFGFDNATRFYMTKMRTFLSDVALGMVPSIRWDGRYSASGGYLVLKPNGDLVCLYAADRDKFRDYLLLNTRLETGHTKKHGFGQVELHPKAGLRILLNLQIRFKALIDS